MEKLERLWDRLTERLLAVERPFQRWAGPGFSLSLVMFSAGVMLLAFDSSWFWALPADSYLRNEQSRRLWGVLDLVVGGVAFVPNRDVQRASALASCFLILGLLTAGGYGAYITHQAPLAVCLLFPFLYRGWQILRPWLYRRREAGRGGQ